MLNFWRSLLIVLVGFLACCANAQTIPAQALGPGWQCLLVPTSFDGPGTIFSVDISGVERQVKDLGRAKLLNILTGPVAFGKISISQKTAGEVSASLLEKLFHGVGGSVKAEGHKFQGSSLEFGDVVQETTESVDFDPIVNKWFNTHVNPAPGVRYFIVRSAYSAAHIYYHLSKDDLLAIGGEANLKQVVQAKAEISRGTEGSYDLDQTVHPRLRVCIQASELIRGRGLNAQTTEYSVVSDTGGVPEIKIQEQPIE